jgi:hypothetical protein
MRMKSSRHVSTLVIVVLCSLASGASAQAPLIAPTLMQRALSEGSVRVIVELGGMTFFPEGFLPDDIAIAAQRQNISAVQNTILQALSGVQHRVTRRFETVPLIAIEASPDALRILESMRNLAIAVHEDRVVEPLLPQSGPLVGAPAAWNLGFDGSGTVIAILDTGVDLAWTGTTPSSRARSLRRPASRAPQALASRPARTVRMCNSDLARAPRAQSRRRSDPPGASGHWASHHGRDGNNEAPCPGGCGTCVVAESAGGVRVARQPLRAGGT